MHRQYRAIKKRYPDAIVFFRLGDFYETFDDDAAIVAQVCDVVLTRRAFSKGENMPMAGVPYHSAEGYIQKLIGAGYKVAVAEQLEQPRGDQETQARRTRLGKAPSAVTTNYANTDELGVSRTGLVDRQVVRVVTPGTLTEPGLLDARRNNYLAAIILEGDRAGIAYVDITTGEFQATEVRSANELPLLVQQELDRLQPAELLVPQAVTEATRAVYKAWSAEARSDGEPPAVAENGATPGDGAGPERRNGHRRGHHTETATQAWRVPGHITPTDERTWRLEIAREVLRAQFKVATLDGFGVAKLPLATRAAGAILAYLKETHASALAQLTHLGTYSTEAYMALDPATRRNLEITVSTSGSKQFSLLNVIDTSQTPMGSRLLGRWLNQPLLDLPKLQARQEAVQALITAGDTREVVRGVLKGLPDIERLTNRVLQGIAGPRDLLGLRQALTVVPALRDAFEEEGVAVPFRTLLPKLQSCEDVVDLIGRAIADDASNILGSGDAIKAGYNEMLDQLRTRTNAAKSVMANLEERERARTSIPSLKVGYNKIFGYYIEISNAHKDKVPSDYIRRQTLVNCERYITAEMKESESLILSATDTLVDLEKRLFAEVLAQVAAAGERLLGVASAVAHIDVFAALAEGAVRNHYVRPELAEDDRITILQGRHPVVEKTLRDEIFVPNDVELANDDAQIIVLTGPNMAGKSVYLKQIAQIVLLAQIGAWVPADRAHVGVVDRIFTRVGAQDDIATGQSTFMVEMVETANILNHASPRSLIILDEIGRGTSTYDGLAIARAVVEYLHNNPRLGAKTLFATHYHELTEMERLLPRVRNYNVAVAEQGEALVFLRKVVPGGADRSYGVHVARMAGVPKSIVQRAEAVLHELEAGGTKERRRAVMQDLPSPAAPGAVPNIQLSLFGGGPDPLVAELRDLKVDDMTPIEALSKLYELRQKARESGGTGGG